MKANELRIGNWVKWDDEDIYYQIESINENTAQEIAPIPLTPEILEKAGFERRNENFDFTHENGIRVCLCSNGIWRNVNHIFPELEKEPVVNYLHQLQNLYFALTDEELEIDL